MKTTCDETRKQAHTFEPREVMQGSQPQMGKGHLSLQTDEAGTQKVLSAM